MAARGSTAVRSEKDQPSSAHPAQGTKPAHSSSCSYWSAARVPTVAGKVFAQAAVYDSGGDRLIQEGSRCDIPATSAPSSGEYSACITGFSLWGVRRCRRARTGTARMYLNQRRATKLSVSLPPAGSSTADDRGGVQQEGSCHGVREIPFIGPLPRCGTRQFCGRGWCRQASSLLTRVHSLVCVAGGRYPCHRRASKACSSDIQYARSNNVTPGARSRHAC